jgi:hypothetical protein
MHRRQENLGRVPKREAGMHTSWYLPVFQLLAGVGMYVWPIGFVPTTE